MNKAITATEAVRKFSELLNTIKYKGAQYTILRGSKPMATLAPTGSLSHERTLGELSSLLKKLPKLGDEAAAFEKDLKEAAKKQPALPKGRPWA